MATIELLDPSHKKQNKIILYQDLKGIIIYDL